MKNKLSVAIEHKLNLNETVSTLENLCFVNINEQIIRSGTPLEYYDLLNFIAGENKLKCHFTNLFSLGNSEHIAEAQNILINSVKYN